MDEEENPRLKRLSYIYGIAFSAMAALILRLGYLQIVHSAEYRAEAGQVQYARIPILPKRGYIYDQHMRLLAYNEPTYSIVYVTLDSPDQHPEAVARVLSPLLKQSSAKLVSQLEQHRAYDNPVILLESATPKQISYVFEHQSLLPGVRVLEDSRRMYPNGPLAGHLLGYVHAQSPETVEQYAHENYLPSQRVGITGVEEAYERVLQGKVGYEVWQMNFRGLPMRNMGVQPVPRSGQSLRLTIDAPLQASAEELVSETVREQESRHGQQIRDAEAVMLDVHTGGVLCMVSYPYYDPNWFTDASSYQKHAHYLNSRILTPTINHVLTSPRYPGSTVKPVNIIAGFAGKVIGPDTHIDDHGSVMVGTYEAHDWKLDGHGQVGPARAIAVSCDTFMYDVGMWLARWHDGPPVGESFAKWYRTDRLRGLNTLFGWEAKFGLGPKTGIDLPGEVSGRYYTNDTTSRSVVQYHLERSEQALQGAGHYENNGLLYDNAFAAIGQMQEFTPLQLAESTLMLANGGTFIQPHVVDAILTADGRSVVKTLTPTRRTVHIPAGGFDVVHKGLEDAVRKPEGTASRFFKGTSYALAGKTGTAEISQFGEKTDISLFIGYAPVNHPQVAIAVMVPGSAGRSDAAVPLARRLLDCYFAGRTTSHSPTGVLMVPETSISSDSRLVPWNQSRAFMDVEREQ